MQRQHDQSLALLQFKKTLSIGRVPSTWDFLYFPKPYPKTESWKEDTDCCSREGITCDVETEISYLSGLVSLDLSRNFELIPDIFNKLVQNLTQLQELELSYTDMSLIASSSLMNLSSSLTSLKLENCALQGKFPDIGHVSKLVSLDLSGAMI
ncbi:hypothetical protein GH714_036700 [Hevea brasiliensis]|uniref:Leucine-rich repeat-containing N-terminal plant-type domain-containing protein n=1 Tax=Hevea brasiliensis TaxID=3981 RepID=A0A6A6M6N0_HEVBR|nr:hypothetical protein GH714_036700 [Hevea brasiliensis]